MKRDTLLFMGILIFALNGCAVGKRSEPPRPRAGPTARDIHAASSRAHPDELRAWQEAGRRALRDAIPVGAGFRERVRFPRSEPAAIAYRFTLVRGQSLSVRIDPIDPDGVVFAEGFHRIGDMFRPAATMDATARGITILATADGEYVLRIQPGIGAGGTYEVVAAGAVALTFPVAGGSRADIGSPFGEARDNGARAHEGVDIFAPRGTAVLAAADGFIEQARNTPTGGLVIWQRDSARGLTYYYAHMDELIAREGAYVRAGDVIGRVGDTGNARGTRPHLHFGVYRPGTIALDPAPMLAGNAALGGAGSRQ